MARPSTVDLEVLRPQRVLFVQGTDSSDKIEISERDGLVRVAVNNEIHAYSGVTRSMSTHSPPTTTYSSSG